MLGGGGALAAEILAICCASNDMLGGLWLRGGEYGGGGGGDAMIICMSIHLVIRLPETTYAELPGRDETGAQGGQELVMLSIAAGCKAGWRSQGSARRRSQ